MFKMTFTTCHYHLIMASLIINKDHSFPHHVLCICIFLKDCYIVLHLCMGALAGAGRDNLKGKTCEMSSYIISFYTWL